MWKALFLVAAATLATLASSPQADDAAQRIHLIIHGRVQGVGFRAFTVEEAQKRKLRGWVRNLASGNEVELVAEGPSKPIADFTEQVKKGPSGAKVEKIEQLPPPDDELPQFEQRPTK